MAGMPWQQKLQSIIDKHNRQALNKPKVISYKTMEERARTIFLAFRQMREGGFKVDDPSNLKPKHIDYLCARWLEEKLSAATLQSRLSIMRGFCKWIHKDGMVMSPAHYFGEHGKRSYIAKEDKSFSAVGIDIDALIAKVLAEDFHVGMQLTVQFAFGLRRKEAVMFKPFRADKGEYLSVTDGTKGGRDRIVPIRTDSQRQALTVAKALAKTPDGFLGNPQLTLEQALYRYSNLVRKHGITEKLLGVTGHGLRHQYANDRYEEIAGEASPVRGGHATGVDDELARLTVTEELGHSRKQITAAYYGSSKNLNK